MPGPQVRSSRGGHDPPKLAGQPSIRSFLAPARVALGEGSPAAEQVAFGALSPRLEAARQIASVESEPLTATGDGKSSLRAGGIDSLVEHEVTEVAEQLDPSALAPGDVGSPIVEFNGVGRERSSPTPPLSCERVFSAESLAAPATPDIVSPDCRSQRTPGAMEADDLVVALDIALQRPLDEPFLKEASAHGGRLFGPPPTNLEIPQTPRSKRWSQMLSTRRRRSQPQSQLWNRSQPQRWFVVTIGRDRLPAILLREHQR